MLLSPLFRLIRRGSARPRTMVLYSYLVAGFTLPFVVPAVKTSSLSSSTGNPLKVEPLGLHHCCR
ncbi:hypothetical protein BDD12DRAFT_851116 [Trichophaea hybrida]|nr:hypothetical protein BDD12DRAFT_851116 [Trichophaea hybrida]